MLNLINFSILQLFDDLLDHFELGFELSRLDCESARQLLDFEWLMAAHDSDTKKHYQHWYIIRNLEGFQRQLLELDFDWLMSAHESESKDYHYWYLLKNFEGFQQLRHWNFKNFEGLNQF